ncbi:MAG: HD domain-containing protein, partial [Dehalococcoidia bacterium]
MSSELDRETILESVYENVRDGNMRKHMLATEAIMRSLARRLGEDEEEWGLTGLIHDIDAELVKHDMSVHSRLGAD